jgi:hypothetical protein
MPLDDGLLGVGAHRIARSAAAEQQAERRHDHRLARASLARDRREAGAERQPSLIDDAERTDLDVVEH